MQLIAAIDLLREDRHIPGSQHPNLGHWRHAPLVCNVQRQHRQRANANAQALLERLSSVLYGTVPELSDGDTGHALAGFYTSVIGAGGMATIVYGMVADHSNKPSVC